MVCSMAFITFSVEAAFCCCANPVRGSAAIKAKIDVDNFIVLVWIFDYTALMLASRMIPKPQPSTVVLSYFTALDTFPVESSRWRA